MSRRDELAGAFMLLTRLPAARFTRTETPAAACVWAYPLVGAVVGAIGAAVFALARLGLPSIAAAILAVAATALATGALHEDGLADTADGFGGGRTAERKLAIMRDSRIGSYGALALLLSLEIRIMALATLGDSRSAATALVASGALSRGAMLVPLLRLPPARATGLAAPLAAATPGTIAAGLILAAAFGLLGTAAIPAALLAAAAMTHLARRQIGGYTGDVLGATQQMAECAALLALLLRFNP